MIISSQLWLKWATLFMPSGREDWLKAMKSELDEISNPSDRNVFAFGCFKTALMEGVRSRKGLSWLARTGGASLLFSFSTFVILWSTKDVSQPETLVFAKVMSALGFSYMFGATLLMASLRGLKVYAGIGFGMAAMGWGYFRFARPSYEYIPTETLTAISFEAAGFMAILFMAAVYLHWLYDPSIHDF